MASIEINKKWSLIAERRLAECGFINPAVILDKYNEPHRYFHNWDHIVYMFELAEEKTIKLTDGLFLAIIFHDIVYNPMSTTNEQDSVNLYDLFSRKETLNPELDELVFEAILSTRDHKPVPGNIISEQLCFLDMHILSMPYPKLLEYEKKIFKEYQFADWYDYQEKRIEFLSNVKVGNPDIYKLIDYIRYWQPKIGVFAGSFMPFHKGHLNVLQKAERIFDKVIIARGTNTAKQHSQFYKIPDSILFTHQCLEYDGFLTMMLKQFKYPVVLVRGLRNDNDLMFETQQAEYLRDMNSRTMPDIVYIPCDVEYRHISSSAIRDICKISPIPAKQYMVD